MSDDTIKSSYNSLDDVYCFNPYKDADAINDNIKYCHEVFERIIPKIAAEYNERFSLDKSEKFYSVILSNWLMIYIEQMLEKYTSLKHFESFNSDDFFLDLSQRLYASDQLDYVQMVKESKTFNKQIYSQVFAFLFPSNQGKSHGEESLISVSLDYTAYSRQYLGFHPWEIAKKLTKVVNNFFYNSSAIMSTTYNDKWAFTFSVRSFFKTYVEDMGFRDAVFKSEINVEKRGAPFWGNTEDEFEEVLSALFLQHCPVSYFELFEDLRSFVIDKYPQAPQFVYTAIGLASNTLLAYMLAEHCEKTKILIQQHGGNYGTDALHSYEFYERRIADSYYTWGWSDNGQTIPLPSPILLPFQKIKATNKVCKGISLYLTGMPKVHFRLMQCNICAGNFLKYYLSDVQKFLTHIPNLYEITNVRGYPSSGRYGHGELKLLKDKFTTIEFEDFSKSFVESVSKTAICIIGHLATVHIQTMVAGKPTLIFIQRDLYKHREASIPYFDALERVGVLHYSPESAAKKLLEIYRDPLAWWHQADVKEAVQQFLSVYGKTSDDTDRAFRLEFEKYQ